MDFAFPNKTGFVIYSKNECIFCSKVKMMLKECSLDFNEIKCDKYMLDDKSSFLSFMSEISMMIHWQKVGTVKFHFVVKKSCLCSHDYCIKP